MSAEPSSSIVLQAEVSELDRLNRWIEALCARDQIPPPLAFRVDLCLTEVVTNVISYAYPQDEARQGQRPVTIYYTFMTTELGFEVVDQGIAFDPTTYVSPALSTSLEAAEIGGRGLRLVHRYVGSMHYRRDARCNRVELRFPRERLT